MSKKALILTSGKDIKTMRCNLSLLQSARRCFEVDITQMLLEGAWLPWYT